LYGEIGDEDLTIDEDKGNSDGRKEADVFPARLVIVVERPSSLVVVDALFGGVGGGPGRGRGTPAVSDPVDDTLAGKLVLDPVDNVLAGRLVSDPVNNVLVDELGSDPVDNVLADELALGGGANISANLILFAASLSEVAFGIGFFGSNNARNVVDLLILSLLIT